MELLSLDQEPLIALKPPREWELRAGQVRLWTWSLQADQAGLGQMQELLSGDELARARGFKFARDQRRFVAARAGMRQILAQILEDAPESLRFEAWGQGKPSLWGQEGPGALRFNLSHSGDMALLAAARGFELGVDLEEETQDLRLMHMAELAFNAPEREWLLSQAPLDYGSAFFKIWTLKEALLKARAESLAMGLSLRSVRPMPDGYAELRDYPGGQLLEDWRALSFSPCPGFRAGLAYNNEKNSIITIDSPIQFEYPYQSKLFKGRA